MASQTTTTRHSRQYSLTSDMEDKGERKREYNRLAQREFRRRRKEHLKNLEQMQKEQNNEQSEEIERLRYQNDELQRENEALRAQMYGSTAPPSHFLASTSLNMPNNRSYSLSPSISGTSMSADSPPAGMAQELMSLSLASPQMLPPSMQTYTDASIQPYSMVHQPGLHHADSQSSPESSGYRNSLEPNLRSLNMGAHPILDVPGQPRTSSAQSTAVINPYDRNRARAELHSLFKPLLTSSSALTDPATTPLRPALPVPLPSSLATTQQNTARNSALLRHRPDTLAVSARASVYCSYGDSAEFYSGFGDIGRGR